MTLQPPPDKASALRKLSPDLSPEEQYQRLSFGAVDLIEEKEFKAKLERGKPLKVKAGFDPSRPDLHLGHFILIQKLREFQELGHQVIFVVGDWTACIGDPSMQNRVRPALSFETAKKNAESYMAQATGPPIRLKEAWDEGRKKLLSFFQRLDPAKTTLVYNSKWLDKLSLRDFVTDISSKFTVARQLERDDFSKRWATKKPIGLHEFLYPLFQAYDSLQLKADVEIGGTDQKFNLLLGRKLQLRARGGTIGGATEGATRGVTGAKPQTILTLPLLEGLDTGDQSEERGRKMSKSLNNAIGFKDRVQDIYGKVMSISDALLARWLRHFTLETDRDFEKLFREKTLHPKKEKEKLAWAIVCAFCGEEKAEEAREEFQRVFSKGGLPDQIPEKILPPSGEEPVRLLSLLKSIGLFDSISSARRGIEAGAVKSNGKKLLDREEVLNLKSGDEFLFSFGKRKYIRLKIK